MKTSQQVLNCYKQERITEFLRPLLMFTIILNQRKTLAQQILNSYRQETNSANISTAWMIANQELEIFIQLRPKYFEEVDLCRFMYKSTLNLHVTFLNLHVTFLVTIRIFIYNCELFTGQ